MTIRVTPFHDIRDIACEQSDDTALPVDFGRTRGTVGAGLARPTELIDGSEEPLLAAGRERLAQSAVRITANNHATQRTQFETLIPTAPAGAVR